MDPRTGGILALAVAPGFDANRFPSVSDDRKRNRAVTDTYEPGSTFKVVTVAGALETGLVTPSTEYTLPYQIQVADRKIHDAEPRGTETMTVHDILTRSSNVGVVTIAEALGKERIVGWIDRFGFGAEDGIEFPERRRASSCRQRAGRARRSATSRSGRESRSRRCRWSRRTARSPTTASGCSRTSSRRSAASRPLEPKRRVVHDAHGGPDATRMLRDVVEEGSGTAAQVPGYRIAGKTGTAAKPDEHGGYSDYRYVASFVGFVPAKDPRLVVLVTVDEPRGAIWGGVVAAPAFAEIAKFALQYLEVPPGRPVGAGWGHPSRLLPLRA